MTTIAGRLVRGLGQAADFTQVDWVRRQLIDLTGIDPHPGTVNIRLEDAHNLGLWQDWREQPGLALRAAEPGFCNARCYPARIAGKIPAAVILPELPGYPPDKLELVVALPLRQHLALHEGARIEVELCLPLAATAVLFDIDGTLVDSARAYLEVARAAARPYGLEVTELHVRHCLASGSNFWKDVVPADRSDHQVIMKSMASHAKHAWPEVLRQHGRLFAGVAATLGALRERGFVLGIVSGAHPTVLDLLQENGILDMFDSVILGTDVAKPKPDPEGIAKCLHALGVAPARAIYVGDTPIDIQTSRAAGVYAVGVLTGAGSSASMSAQAPDRLVCSLASLLDCLELDGPAPPLVAGRS